MSHCGIGKCNNIICYRLNIKICEQHKCDVYNCPNVATRDIELLKFFEKKNDNYFEIKQVCGRKNCFDEIIMK